MTSDDFIYALLLFGSFPMGYVLRRLNTIRSKQVLSSFVGVATVVIVCGADGLHALLTTAVNTLIISVLSPKICHLVSFGWCFGYIVFFRTTHYVGLPKVVPHANAVQLLLTLKLVGLAFEVHDSYVTRKKAEKDRNNDQLRLECCYKTVRPSVMDMLFYSSCYIGLLTGPYYKFRTYYDMLSQKDSPNLDVTPYMMGRLKWIPVVGLAYVILSHFIYIEYVASDEFYEHGFWFRLFYMAPMFTVFRFRMYFAWLMSEVVCIAAGLGCYPKASKPRIGHGPTDLKQLELIEREHNVALEWDFETIHNIHMWGCEFACGTREGMRSWNMSVQFWLASHVYKRVPLKALRTSMTMAVSAFWHGIHPGYYLSFMTIPPTAMAETAMSDAFRPSNSTWQQVLYDGWAWFWKCRFLDYMAMGFLLLSYERTTRYWASIYFIPHIIIVIFIIVGSVFKPKSSSQAGLPKEHPPANKLIEDKKSS